MEILYYFLFLSGGSIIGMFLGIWLTRIKIYGGSIIVKNEEEKIVYTLVLRDDPEQLQYMDKVIFKIIKSDIDSVDSLIRS